MATRTAITVRPIEPPDLADIVRIDSLLTGQARPDYWRTRLDIAALRPPWMSLVAETDGRVAGFLLGWIGESEFGIAARTGWIDLIGIDPRYRGLGLGRQLVERFLDSARELRAVQTLATLIDLDQADIREFFVHLGFRHGPMIQLERAV
jgi:GNAT superfamily N-acetyltransferase